MTSLVNNLGGTLGFGENSIDRNDDGYQAGVSLSEVFGAARLNFFGTTYTYVSINNNGNVTFSNNSLQGLSTYTPFSLENGGFAIIAPFLADVDTRLDGGIANANQVTPTPGGTSQGSDLVWYDLDTTGNGTLTVTWDDVGYFSSSTDKLNAFQLQIVGRGSGNFDIVLRYENIDWTTGNASGGTGGLGGTVARAGYSTGNGSSWYELGQSGMQAAMLALETTAGNTGVAGYYRFRVTSGTSAGETLNGTSGDDLIAGEGGNDTINGLAGNDYLIGNGGADRLVGGTGNDTYTIDGSDTLVELAGAGADTVVSNITYTLPANFENLRLTGSSNINGTGNSAANVLSGNTGNNTLNGMGGSDTVDYSLATAGITVDLSSSAAQAIASQGSDTLRSIENVMGSFFGDTLRGTAGANVLNGDLGADTMVGRDGSDTYYVDNTSDVVSESNASAVTGGTDTVLSYLDAYTLRNNVENGRILSAGTANLTGNALGNVLTGGSGANTLNGSAGNDTLNGGNGNDSLNGGTGSDTMNGGAGNDVFFVDSAGDVVVEAAAQGTDRINSSVTRTLTDVDVENLTLTGSGAINGTGNSAANVLTGNTGINTLNGAGGNDTLAGGLGNDVLTGGAGSDFFLFNAALDALSNRDAITDFSVADDTVQLENGIFTSLAAPGTLAAGSFLAGAGVTAAADADDYLIYDSTSGALYYDAEGTGGAAAVQFATLDFGLALTNADFVVL